MPAARRVYRRRLRQTCGAVLIRHPQQPRETRLHAADVDLPGPPAGPLTTGIGLSLDLTAAGTGVAPARYLLAEAGLHAGRLVRLRNASMPDAYAHHLVWLPRLPMADAAASLRRWLLAEMHGRDRRRGGEPEDSGSVSG